MQRTIQGVSAVCNFECPRSVMRPLCRRINVDEGGGKRGWVLLRQSLHDPLLVSASAAAAALAV